MKKQRQKKTGNQTRSLQAQDLATVCGGGISGSGRAVVGGGTPIPADNGVIDSRN